MKGIPAYCTRSAQALVNVFVLTFPNSQNRDPVHSRVTVPYPAPYSYPELYAKTP